MKWYLLLMFLITPPGPPMKRENKPWTMQGTTTMEFDKLPDCESVAKEIDESVAKTYTTTVEAWCICRPVGSLTCPVATADTRFLPSRKLNPAIQSQQAAKPGPGVTVFQLQH
jgi:hypothetical protein